MIAAGVRSVPDGTDLVPQIHKVAFSQSYPAHPGAAAKQLTTMGMCLMNGYEVFKVQIRPPHKRGTGEGLSVAFHLMH